MTSKSCIVERYETYIGKTYGCLTLQEILHKKHYDNRVLGLWNCKCGNKTSKPLSRVIKGYINSCGCLIGESHGFRYTPEYQVWRGIKKRCNVKSSPAYKDYGARGIFVCNEWNKSFSAFIGDMGQRPTSDHSIERIDNNGPYNKDNCIWSDIITQSNNKRNNRFITHKGKTATVAQWAKITNQPTQRLYKRIESGWNDNDVITGGNRGRA